jgi:hypothetical protein
MAVAVTHLAGATNIETFPLVTSSVSPSGEVLLCVQAGDAGSTTISSVSGCGLTWSQVTANETNWGGSNYRDWVWKGIGTASSGAITVTFSADPYNATYHVCNVTGHNTSGMIVQSTTATGSSNTASATLGAFADAGNATFGFAIQNQNDGVYPGTGFTELDQQIRGAFTTSSATEWRADNDTSVTATFDTSNPWAIHAMEIAVAAAGGGTNPKGPLGNPFFGPFGGPI